jgi:hypothetical protein
VLPYTLTQLADSCDMTRYLPQARRKKIYIQIPVHNQEKLACGKRQALFFVNVIVIASAIGCPLLQILNAENV